MVERKTELKDWNYLCQAGGFVETQSSKNSQNFLRVTLISAPINRGIRAWTSHSL